MRLDHLLSKEKEKSLHFKGFLFLYFFIFYGGIAQLARAPALQAGGQEFDSPHLHQYIEKYIDKEEKR